MTGSLKSMPFPIFLILIVYLPYLSCLVKLHRPHPSIQSLDKPSTRSLKSMPFPIILILIVYLPYPSCSVKFHRPNPSIQSPDKPSTLKLSHLGNFCSVAVVSSVVVMSSHIITNRMQFYFFQSKCVVIVSSACHFPTRGGMQSKSVKRSLRFPRSKFENFMGYP